MWCSGLGGTLSGCAEYLRGVNPDVKIALTDPFGAKIVSYFVNGVLEGHGSSISEGIGQGRITGNIEGFRPDIAVEVPDTDMIPVLNDLQEHEGLALGGSAGINGKTYLCRFDELTTCEQWLERFELHGRLGPGTIVLLFFVISVHGTRRSFTIRLS